MVISLSGDLVCQAHCPCFGLLVIHLYLILGLISVAGLGLMGGSDSNKQNGGNKKTKVRRNKKRLRKSKKRVRKSKNRIRKSKK